MAIHKPKEDSISLRLATPDDYEGILDINRNVYGGLDYMSSMFHTYIKNPLRLIGVAEIGGRIVALEMAYIVDDDSSVVWQAGRVNKEFQGQNISGKLEQYLKKVILEKYPRIQREQWTSVNWPVVSKVLVKHPELTCLMKRPRVSFDALPRDMRNSLDAIQSKDPTIMNEVNNVIVLTPSEANAALQHCDHPRLFPTGFILVNWEPFLIKHSSNYPLFTNESITMVTKNEEGQIRSISLGTIVRSTAAFRYRVDFYGDSESDAICHVIKHLIMIWQHEKIRNISFSILMPETMNTTIVKKVVSEDMTLENQLTREDVSILISSKFKMPSKL